MENVAMSMLEKEDATVVPATVIPDVPVVVVVPRRTINPLIPICCIGLSFFFIALIVVLALIPVYLRLRNGDRQNVQSTQFTLYLVLRNDLLPLGSLSVENCAIIQDELRRRALSSDSVRSSVPTIISCTVTGNATTTTTTTTDKPMKRQTIQGNQIDIAVSLSSGDCISDKCSVARTHAFINLILGSGEFTSNMTLLDGSHFNFIAVFLSSSVVGSVPSRAINPDLIFYGVTHENQLLRINTQHPATVLSTVTITGLKEGDTVTNIDFRPATGALYGTSNNQLYVIDENTGVARTVGNPLDPDTDGSIISMEFNPVFDVLRVVTSAGANLPINPETGEIISTNIMNSEHGISVAYNNNLAGASTSSLFIINVTTDSLFRQNPPSDYAVVQVGSGFGIDISNGNGFDIAPNGLALACVQVGGTFQLYLVDLNRGTLNQKLGEITQPIITLAIPTAPVAYAIIKSNNSLLIINSLDSNLLFVSKNISGLEQDEKIVGLDMRPLTGQLYGLGSTSRLYTLDMGMGDATAVGSGTFTPLLSGTTFGFDFNPTIDQIRVVSDVGQNLRLNPSTGLVAGQDTNLSPGTPHITAVAYTNNIANTATTILYDIDSNSNRLFIQTPPNNGILVDVGPLGIDADDYNGFDIGSKSGTAVALLTVKGVTSVYQINLNTGAATRVPNTTFPIAARAYTLGLNV